MQPLLPQCPQAAWASKSAVSPYKHLSIIKPPSATQMPEAVFVWGLYYAPNISAGYGAFHHGSEACLQLPQAYLRQLQ